MGKCYSCCVLKCFPCCEKKRNDEKRTQPQETAPPAPNSTSTAIADENVIQTYQEFVDCLTQRSEKGQKKNKSKKKKGSFARWLERMVCCKFFGQQPPAPAFWIEPPPGYLERRCDI